MAKRKKVPHHRGKGGSELSGIKPIPAEDLTFEKMHLYNNKRLLVTALALNKKSKKEKNPEVSAAMNVLAKGISEILQGRMNIAAGSPA